MAVNYVVCAAGDGTRFRRLFGDMPKPLLRLLGASLLEWSLRSLPIFADDRIILVTRTAHRVKERLADTISARYPFNDIRWVELPALTRGQLETALLCADELDPAASVAIFNSDTYFQSPTLVPLMADRECEGVVPCSREEGTAWSFCAVNERDHVIDVREKERISEWATVGLYFFRDGTKWLRRAREALATGDQRELYVAPLYQQYIRAGERVVIDRVSLFRPMGTPEQVERYWNTSIDAMQAANVKRTLVVDLDGTLTIDDPARGYADKVPNLEVVRKVQEYARKGYEIVIHSSRRMLTHGSDEARVLADIGAITLDWLKRHEIPFHGMRFGKPFANDAFYIDDKAIRPSEFVSLSEEQLHELLRGEKKKAEGT
jgi:capsule biosynthesis phosphatase